eukprot:5126114-Pyramimonas_sp.AAC.2
MPPWRCPATVVLSLEPGGARVNLLAELGLLSRNLLLLALTRSYSLLLALNRSYSLLLALTRP